MFRVVLVVFGEWCVYVLCFVYVLVCVWVACVLYVVCFVGGVCVRCVCCVWSVWWVLSVHLDAIMFSWWTVI